jgi:hypothetical protein
MVDVSTLDNEDLLIKDGKTFTLEELRTQFLKLREEDDEFARDYRKGEFQLWLNDQNYSII